MRTPILGLVAAAALFAPAVALAQGESLTSAFQAVCLATDAAPAAVAAQAAATGYVRPPNAMIAAMPTSMDIKDPVVTWKVYDGGLDMVVTGHMTLKSTSALEGDVCMLMQIPSAASPTHQLADVLGVGAPITSGGAEMFIYELQRDGHRRAVDANHAGDLVGLMEQRRLRIAGIGATAADGQQIGIMFLMIPQPAPPPPATR